MNDTLEIAVNKYGFYELADKPSQEELKEYYAKKYYQENQGSYEVHYTAEELLYFKNKTEQKYNVIQGLRTSQNTTTGSLLDIGCGEGFTLDFFQKKKWEITGIDFSDFGCKKFNPHCIPFLLIGDLYQQMTPLIQAKKQFDVIWLDNVLEHVLDPLDLLKESKKLLHPDGIIVIEVPNDFSVLQQHLLTKKHIQSQFWVVVPDHISYFNAEGLKALAVDAGLNNEYTMADFPIDFNLINPDTNYNKDKTKGKNAHYSRIELDNLMHSISIEKVNQYYKALADLGLGRQIISFLKHDK